MEKGGVLNCNFNRCNKVSSLRRLRRQKSVSFEFCLKTCYQINEIMESFGGAICRESVFTAQYEPKVAVYLRDRRSQALTLQLSGPQTVQNRQSFEFDADKRYIQPVSAKVTNS